MSVEKHRTRPGWWYIVTYPKGRKGKRDYTPVEGTYEEACALEEKIRQQLKKTPLTGFPQVAEVAPLFMAHYALDHQAEGVKRTRRSLKTLLPFFGAQLFTSITPALVDLYKTQRLNAGVIPSTINKELSALSSLCKYAADQGYCNEIKIKRFPPKLTKAPLPDVPTRSEVLSIINSMDWPKCGLFATMYYGGLRVAEVTYLKTAKVFPERGLMVVLGKGQKERAVPIVPQLMPIIQRRIEENPGEWMWAREETGVPYKDLRAAITWACKRAGVTRHIYPHLFRHAFGVHATESGIGLKHLQQVMGHTTSKTTEIYSHLAADALIKEMGRFG